MVNVFFCIDIETLFVVLTELSLVAPEIRVIWDAVKNQSPPQGGFFVAYLQNRLWRHSPFTKVSLANGLRFSGGTAVVSSGLDS